MGLDRHWSDAAIKKAKWLYVLWGFVIFQHHFRPGCGHAHAWTNPPPSLCTHLLACWLQHPPPHQACARTIRMPPNDGCVYGTPDEGYYWPPEAIPCRVHHHVGHPQWPPWARPDLGGLRGQPLSCDQIIKQEQLVPSPAQPRLVKRIDLVLITTELQRQRDHVSTKNTSYKNFQKSIQNYLNGAVILIILA